MWPSSDQLDALVEQFAAATLPAAQWTHQAHLAVGTWHVVHFGPAEALPRVRAGILRLNEAHGTPNTDTRGYHETITRAYVELLAAFVSDGKPTDVAGHVRAVLASPLAQKEALLAYYTRERLMSVEARRQWVEPDVAPLAVPSYLMRPC